MVRKTLFRAGLSSLLSLSVMSIYPISASASVSWLTDVGVSEATAAPADLETAGGAALLALAAGTTIYAAQSLSSNQYVSQYASQVGADAWSYMKGAGSSLQSAFAGASTTAGQAVTMTSGMYSSVKSWVTQEMQKLGMWASGPAAAISPDMPNTSINVVLTDSINKYSTDMANTTVSNWISSQESQGHNYIYVFQQSPSGMYGDRYYAASTPIDFSFETWTSFGVTQQGFSTICSSTIYKIDGQSNWSTSSGSGEHNWEASGDVALANDPGASYVAPSANMPYAQPGDKMYLPPVATNSATGNLAIPSATPVGNTGHYGLSADGTTATDVSTGQSVAISDSSTVSDTWLGRIAGDIESFFDLTKPINFAPIEDVGGQLTKTFPFSLPWDLQNAVSSMGVSSTTPPSYPVDLGSFFGKDISVNITVPSEWDKYLPYIRTLILIFFSVGLIYATRRLLGGDV